MRPHGAFSAFSEARGQQKTPEAEAPGVLVRVVIQNFLKKPVISTVFKADE
jgi:hypothetical protein